MLPDLPKHLLPREDEVGKVREKLLGTGTAAVAITAPIRTALAVRGMGGAGKSVLANAVARDKSVRKHFKDGIFWITVGQEGSGTESKAKILQAGLAKRLRATLDADTVQEGKQQIRELLASKACLIILDDVWETADAQHLDVVGPDPSSRILITTREGKVATDLDAEEIALGKLSKDQAIALLSTWCSPAVATDPDALTVIKECGYLPLALAICGARAREGAAWKQIAAGLKRADLSSLKRRGLDPAYDSVLSSIAASVDYMEQTEPELARRYRDLAVFPSDEPIPESVVALLWAQTTGCPEDQAGMDLVELQTKSLLTLEGTYPNRHVSLHDLQHDYVKGTHADLKDAHRKLLQGYHDRCNGVWANQEDDSYFFQHLSDHLRAAGREEEARSLLLDCSWLQAKLQATGILPLIADYEPFAANEAMQLIRWALRLSAPNLARDPSRLRSQLHGRLLGIDLADIKRLLGSVPVQPPWLRPLTPSLSRPGGVLLQTLEGLADTIEAVAISPDGRRIISASSSDNGALRVWDLGTGAEVRTLKGHSDSVNALAVDINGRRLISTSHDETLKVWDLETGGEVRTLVGPYDGVRALALSPDGWRAVSASHDGTLSFWDLETGGEVRTLKGPLCDCVIAVTPDGLVISEWCDGGHPLGLMSWHPDAGAEVHTLVGDDSYLGAVAVTHDGRRAVSGSHDGRLTLWDLNSGEKI